LAEARPTESQKAVDFLFPFLKNAGFAELEKTLGTDKKDTDSG
jgi:hypothetical protein